MVETLLGHEELLKLLFDRAFPGVAPHPPSDPLLDRMAAWQETRDAQVCAGGVGGKGQGGVGWVFAAAASTASRIFTTLYQCMNGGVFGGEGGGGEGRSGAAGSTASTGGCPFNVHA